jgi:hypothetical protein
MIFAGIAHLYNSRLIIMESGTVDPEGYVNELVDQSSVIPDMNERYGSNRWIYIQDGASIHTPATTMADQATMVNVVLGWPA